MKETQNSRKIIPPKSRRCWMITRVSWAKCKTRIRISIKRCRKAMLDRYSSFLTRRLRSYAELSLSSKRPRKTTTKTQDAPSRHTIIKSRRWKIRLSKLKTIIMMRRSNWGRAMNLNFKPISKIIVNRQILSTLIKARSLRGVRRSSRGRYKSSTPRSPLSKMPILLSCLNSRKRIS